MRTARQQAAKVLRDANRAHDMAVAKATNATTGALTLDCAWESHATCPGKRMVWPFTSCTCECHRPQAQPRQREAM